MEQRQVIHVPFTGGLDTKSDPRAVNSPKLLIARDVQFDELGGVQTRKPYAAIGTNILGGGTLSNYRCIYECNGELICMTVDTLYSWDSRDSAWVPRGTHLAVSLNEQTRFVTTDDQIDCDRAELSGTIVYAWSNGTNGFAAAIDKATGAVIVAPTLITGMLQPRLVACLTKILLFGVFTNVSVAALDPTSITASIAAAAASGFTTVVATGVLYDVVQIPSADEVVGATQDSTNTSYTSFTCTAGLTIVKVVKARKCDGPIAVACTPDAGYVQIVRGNGTTIDGDLLALTALTDVYTNQNLGTATSTPVNQIAAAFNTPGAGAFKCSVFWSANENVSPGSLQTFRTDSNYVDTGNGIGTPFTVAYWVGVASRAFTYNDRVYVWLAFGQSIGASGAAAASSSGSFQNAYFLYRDDGFLVAKSVYDQGGGLCPTVGRLPNVALTSGSTTFSVSLAKRRVIAVGAGTGAGAVAPAPTAYAERSPQDVTFTFDSSDARRAVRLGKSLYIGAGEDLQYDGVQLTEIGFHVYPWWVEAAAAGASGSMVAGLYAYRGTYRWYNAQGELDRSTTATIANVTVPGGDTQVAAIIPNLSITHKGATPAVEFWRTIVNPAAASPFYLVSGLNPNVTTGANAYVPNVLSAGWTGTFDDEEADSTASTMQNNPENGAILPSLSPPAATMVSATEYRIYLGGIAGAPDTVWYSKQRNDGEVVAFSDTLTFDVPPAGGLMTGVLFHPQAAALVVFRQRAVYAMPGTGYDNGGNGSNFGPAQILSTDIGAVSSDSIGVIPGAIIFKTSKGWYHLDGGLNLKYIGEGAAAFDGDTVHAVHVVDSQHQVRIVTNNRIIVYDYLVDEWAEWTISTGIHACLWNGQYVYLDSSTGPMLEQTNYSTGVNYGMDVLLAFNKPAGPVGRFNARWIMPLGEFRSTCLARLRVGRDYQQDGSGNWTYFDDVAKVPAAVVGGPMQVRHGPSQPNGMESVLVRISAISATLATIALTSGGTTVTITSKIGTSAGNSFSLAHASATSLSSADSGGNLVTLSGPATLTAQQMVDVLTRDSLLVSAAITAGVGSTSFNLTAFTGSLSGGLDWPTGEAMRLTGIGFELGGSAGLFKDLAVAQEG